MRAEVRHRLRTWVAVCAGLLVSGGLAHAARYRWVEQQGLAAACAQQPEQWPCVPRQWIIELFIHQRLGWSSVALVILAAAMLRGGGSGESGQAPSRQRWVVLLASGGTALASAGLVLYNADLSAVGLLAGLLVLVRVVHGPEAHS